MSSEVEREKRRKRKDVRYIPVIGVDMRYLRYLKPFSGLLTVSVILIVGVALLDIIAPWPLKFIIDNVLGGEPFVGPVGDWLTENVGTDQRVLTAVLGLVTIGTDSGYLHGLLEKAVAWIETTRPDIPIEEYSIEFR